MVFRHRQILAKRESASAKAIKRREKYMELNRRLKNYIAVIFVFVIAFPILWMSGCGQNPVAVSANQPVEVKVAFWGSPEEIEIVTTALKPWQESHPGIKIRFEHTPYSGYDSKILTRIAGGAAPDIIAAEVNYFVTFASKNVYVDLTPYEQNDPEFSIQDFFPSIVERFTRNGKLLAIPRDVAPFACVFYNKDIFDHEGIPYPTDDWTWNDLLEKAKALTQYDEKTGRVTQYGFYGWAWQNFVYGNGGALVDDAEHPAKSKLEDPLTLEGIQYFADLINVHKVMPTPMALANAGMGIDLLFSSGRLAMFLSGIWETPQLRQKEGLRWDVAMFPKNANGIRKFGSGGTGYGILKSSKHPKEAWEIVKALTNGKVQAELARRGLAQPAIRKIAEGADWAGSPLPPDNKKMLNEAVAYIVFDPFHPKWREIEAKYVLPELDLIKIGRETARDGMKKIDLQVSQMLEASKA